MFPRSRRKKRYPGLFVVAALAWTPACSDEQATVPLVVSPPNVHVVAQGASVEGANVQADRIVLPVAGNEDVLATTAGDILVGRRQSGTGGNPRGFLRRVRSVTQTGGQILVMTDPAKLTDAVQTGRFEQKVALSQVLSGETRVQSGGDTGTAGYDFSGTSLGSTTVSGATVSAQVTQGRLQFSPVVDIGASFGWFDLDEFHLEVGGAFQSTLAVEIAAEVKTPFASPVTAQLGQSEIPIDEGSFWFSVGIVPVEVSVELNVRVDCAASFQETQSLSVRCDGRERASARNDVRHHERLAGRRPTRLLVHSARTDGDDEAPIALGCQVTPELDFFLYDFVGPYVTIGPSATIATGQGTPQPWQLDAGVSASVGGKVDIFGSTLVDLNMPLFNVQETVDHGTL